MRKVLVPISASGGAQMQFAVAEAISLYRKEPVEIHLLNVQIAVPRYVAGYFKRNDLQRIQEEAGLEELAPARAILDAAGVRCSAHVRVGRGAETIVQTARELGCDCIVMGLAEQADIEQTLFGTLASQVRHLAGAAGGCQVIGS